MLYPTELRARVHHCSKSIWSGQRDLNPRRPAPKAGALPGCAMPRTDNPKSDMRVSNIRIVDNT